MGASSYSEITLPEDFKQVGLIIDEYKKLNKDSGSFQEEGYVRELRKDVPTNKKNKGILAVTHNSDIFSCGKRASLEFDSIMDTIRYFENINIKLDRKILCGAPLV